MCKLQYDEMVILTSLSGKKGRMRDNSIYGEQYLLLFNKQQFSKCTIAFLYITIHCVVCMYMWMEQETKNLLNPGWSLDILNVKCSTFRAHFTSQKHLNHCDVSQFTLTYLYYRFRTQCDFPVQLRQLVG